MDQELETSLRAKIHTLMGWDHGHFPATLPVPLRRYHLGELNSWTEYLVSHKKSSIRALVYHGKEGLFWYAKDGKIRTLFLDNLPIPGDDETTLVDAEWVPAEKTFYIGDAPVVRGRKVHYIQLMERLNTLKTDWLDHKKPSPRDQFKFVIKDHWTAETMGELGNIPQEGLLIRENVSMYRPGRDARFWHWKSAENMKILMRIKVLRDGIDTRYSLWGSTEVVGQEQLYCELPHLKNSNQLWVNNEIVECHYETQKGSLSNSGNHWITGLWTPVRSRTDKVQPEFVKHVWSTATTVQENVTLCEMVTSFNQCKIDEGIEWFA